MCWRIQLLCNLILSKDHPFVFYSIIFYKFTILNKIYYVICRGHMIWLKMQNPRQAKRQKWLQDEHRRTFYLLVEGKGIRIFVILIIFFNIRNLNN